jgi:hypothetical protein
VIATPATVGYEPLRNLIVTKVNGKDIKDIKSLIEAFEQPGADGMDRIEFDDEEFSVYIDEAASDAVDAQLLQRGLSRLSKAEN